MYKLKFYFLLIIILTSFIVADFASAQSSTSDTQALIKQLQAQIEALQKQVLNLSSQLEDTKKEAVATKEEIKELREEIKITRSLRRGVKGDDVRELQEFLSQFPDIYPSGSVTGFFGPSTETAVRKLQQKYGIQSIGVVGPKTISKINELLTEGAGKSGMVPPGLLTAPGIQKKLATTTESTSLYSTSTPIIATTTPGFYTATTTTVTPATPAVPAVPGVTPAVPAQPAIITTSTATSTTATTTSTTATTTAVSFTVYSPNGGEQWTQGSTYSITWTSVGSVPTARISLYEAGSFKEILATDVTNNGLWSWTVPTSTTPGTQYKIRVFNLVYPNNFDDSDNYFSVVAPAPLVTSYPVCGQVVKNVPGEYASIQAAINAASVGDTIRVAAGTYNEGLDLKKSGICLEGAGVDQTIITNSGGTVIVVGLGGDASYVIIKNLTVKGGNNYVGTAPANGMGGGIFTFNAHDILIQSCRITQNNAHTGGGLYANSTRNLTVDHCLIDNNHAKNMGGGVYVESASKGGVFTNVTIANNVADARIGGFAYGWETNFSNLIIRNAIFWGNVGPMASYTSGSTDFGLYWTTSSQPSVSYSDIGGWSGGTGNISLDPKFVSTTDYNLQATSPAINAGDPTTYDPDGSRADMGAYPATIVSAPPDSASLISHWKFDGNGANEIAGRPTAVNVGNATTTSSGGKFGGYAYIPSSGDQVKIPYNSIYDMGDAFSVEFWFRQRSNQGVNQDLVYKGTSPNNYNFKIFRYLWNQANNGAVIAGHTTVNTGYWTQASNNNEPPHGSWHHVVYTKNSSAQAYYIDGVLIHSKDFTQYPEYGGAAKTPAVDIIVGGSAIDTDIDNLKIYNKALSASEVLYTFGSSQALAPQNTEKQLADMLAAVSKLADEVKKLFKR